MFDIAPEVVRWHAGGQEAVLARVVSVTGLSSSWPGQALALSLGHELAGTVLATAADPQLVPVLTQAITALAPAQHPASSAAVVDIALSDEEAVGAGLACGGTARILVQNAADIPGAAWQYLADRAPICLVSDLDGPNVGRTTWFTPETATSDSNTGADADADDADDIVASIASGSNTAAGNDSDMVADSDNDSDTITGDSITRAHGDAVGEGSTRHGADVVQLFGHGTSATVIMTLPGGTRALVEALWPTPRLVVVGEGLLAAALQSIATFLGWAVTVASEMPPAVIEIRTLTSADAVLVLSHDRAVDGPVLQAALACGAGYVGALGSRHTQEARARWLTEREVPQSEIDRVRGPAGLDVGARTPQEIAVSIAAEVLAVRSGTGGQALRDRPGPVHVDGLRTPPPR